MTKKYYCGCWYCLDGKTKKREKLEKQNNSIFRNLLKEAYAGYQKELEYNVCQRCGVVHKQDPVDPEKIAQRHAQAMADEIDREVIERLRRK